MNKIGWLKVVIVVKTILLVGLVSSCTRLDGASRAVPLGEKQLAAATQVKPNATPLEKVLANLTEQTTQTLSYDPAYVKLDYPNGDLPLERGVCADVVVRALRKGGLDLQQAVHEDMKANFSAYPNKWRARATDRNIDHRRVANLMTWFARQRKALPLSKQAADYQPGDVVAWELSSGLLHIGMVSNVRVAGTDRYGVVHNINSGAKLEDVLFAWKIIGHYRYF
jgi:uncharacterized protein